MNTLVTKNLHTHCGLKTISVVCSDIRELDEPIDVMAVSAFYRSYHPTFGTLIQGLVPYGIVVNDLAKHLQIDLRATSNVWLSEQIPGAKLPIGRIGCIESIPRPYSSNGTSREEALIVSMRSYFLMLEIAAHSGISVKTIGMPMIGGGNQGFDPKLVSVPLLNECIRFLVSCDSAERIILLTNNHHQADVLAKSLEASYSLLEADAPAVEVSPGNRLAFISYSSEDKNVADNLCSKLESSGVRVWYAPRDVDENDYASSIYYAINRCTHFIVILSHSSLGSQHVLNEIDLAFKQLITRSIRFLPLKIDSEELGPSFSYYLSRQHWMDARTPPLEKRLDEFVQKLLSESKL